MQRPTSTDGRLEQGSRRPAPARRRIAVLVRMLLVPVGLIVVYALLPLDRPFGTRTVLGFLAGLVAVALLLAWQVRAITRSQTPVLKALEAVTLSLTVFLLLFATTYELLAGSDPHAFTEPLSRIDAFYFVVTVFATVGFGDIAPVSETARLLVTVEMIGDLVLLGLGLRVVVTAVDQGRRRVASGAPPEDRR